MRSFNTVFQIALPVFILFKMMADEFNLPLITFNTCKHFYLSYLDEFYFSFLLNWLNLQYYDGYKFQAGILFLILKEKLWSFH